MPNLAMDYTRKTAMWCAWDMYRFGFKPGSILNVGVGTAPELHVWQWLFPGTPVLGIDPKPLRKKFTGSGWDHLSFVQTAVGSKSMPEAYFCRICSSMACKDQQGHKIHGKWEKVSVSTIDVVAKDMSPPYFIWMDIEGYELHALFGARNILKKTDWICVELTNWVPMHIRKVQQFLLKKGFILRAKFDNDALFSKPIRRRKNSQRK